MPEALPSPRILEHLDAPRGLLLSFPFAGREAAAPGQSRWEASDRSRELLCECHEHLGRDATSLPCAGYGPHPPRSRAGESTGWHAALSVLLLSQHTYARRGPRGGCPTPNRSFDEPDRDTPYI
jgi:hypothetical protein